MFDRSSGPFSFWTIPVVLIILISVSFSSGLFRENRVKVDAPSFYAYLPAAIVYHDLHLNYIDKDPAFFKDKIWYYRIEEGRKLIKHPVGFSVVMSPFFILGHVYAKLTGSSVDGYSMPYQNFMSFGVFVYLFAGLLFLRKVLLKWFSDKAVAITLMSVVIGTNLFWYSTFEGFMTHAVSFSFLSATLYFYFRWIDSGNGRTLFYFLMLFGFVVLIRPLALTIMLYFILHALIKKGWPELWKDLKTNRKFLISGLLLVIVIGSVQLIYWKYATGKWIYDVYKNEPFLFDSPQMIPFLFSFRKGLFIYTPLMLLIIPGLVMLCRNRREFFWPTITLFLVTVYFLSSWWAWSYGISWGMRPMIDIYTFLTIPIAFTIDKALHSILKYPVYVFIMLVVSLNLFQTWQYKNYLIHYDDMTREAYFKGFFQTSPSKEWADALRPYNWNRRVNRLPQIEYSKKQFDQLTNKDTVYLRGSIGYVSAGPNSSFIMNCCYHEVTQKEKFFIIHLVGDTIAVKSVYGRYLSYKPAIHDIIVADSPLITSSEKFVFEYVPGSENKFRIKGPNGLYLAPEEKMEMPQVIRSVASEAKSDQSFRVFLTADYKKDF